MSRIIRHAPLDCYTEHPLTAYGELGEILSETAADLGQAKRLKTAFLLFGPTGNGKSSCVGAFHQVLAERKVLVHWVDCAEWPTDFIDREELVEDLKAATTHILVLDDLGREPKQCHKDVEKVILARSKLRIRLDLFTCNLNVSQSEPAACELGDIYGSAARSRLFGMCRKNVIEFNGPDHRLEV